MSICYSCDYYDSSVDACNCDDKCYTEGYQQGMVDLLMPYDVENIDDLITNVKIKARTDTIEDVIEMIKSHSEDDKLMNELYLYWMEQLKEHTNG